MNFETVCIQLCCWSFQEKNHLSHFAMHFYASWKRSLKKSIWWLTFFQSLFDFHWWMITIDLFALSQWWSSQPHASPGHWHLSLLLQSQVNACFASHQTCHFDQNVRFWLFDKCFNSCSKKNFVSWKQNHGFIWTEAKCGNNRNLHAPEKCFNASRVFESLVSGVSRVSRVSNTFQECCKSCQEIARVSRVSRVSRSCFKSDSEMHDWNFCCGFTPSCPLLDQWQRSMIRCESGEFICSPTLGLWNSGSAVL